MTASAHPTVHDLIHRGFTVIHRHHPENGQDRTTASRPDGRSEILPVDGETLMRHLVGEGKEVSHGGRIVELTHFRPTPQTSSTNIVDRNRHDIYKDLDAAPKAVREWIAAEEEPLLKLICGHRTSGRRSVLAVFVRHALATNRKFTFSNGDADRNDGQTIVLGKQTDLSIVETVRENCPFSPVIAIYDGPAELALEEARTRGIPVDLLDLRLDHVGGGECSVSATRIRG